MGKISTDDDKVFRVSLPGYDVQTADPEECAVHSGFDYPKMEENLVGYEQYTVPNPASITTYNVLTVSHNLGYKPMSQCFVEDADSIYGSEFAMLPYLLDAFTGTKIFCYTTTTQFKIDFVISDAFTASALQGSDWNFKWQVWVND